MLTARYFDGKIATAHAVNLTLEGRDLLLHSADFWLRYPLREVSISERMGNTPRLLTFPGGGHCEVTDHAAFDALLARAGLKHSWLDVLHHSRSWALLAAALTIVALFAAYRYLLPWGSDILAQRVPEKVLQNMGGSTLEMLDQHMLQPSKLDKERQHAIAARFARLHSLPGERMQFRIVFRSAPGIGPNAFALPDGTIVLLDELVNLTKNDNEIVAVLAHERGHVERRHAARMVLQSSVVGLVVAWYAGDFSSLLTTIPVVIVEAGYSRDMEREADEYAKRMLQLNGLSPCLLSATLDKFETSPENAAMAGKAARSSVLDYLSSHPATAERTAQLCPSK